MFMLRLFCCLCLFLDVARGNQCHVQINASKFTSISTTGPSRSCVYKPQLLSPDGHQLLMTNMLVRNKQEVNLSCWSCSQPLTDVHWYRNRKLDAFSDINVNKTTHCVGEQGSLTIPDFDCMDQGDYMCFAACNNRSVASVLYSVRIQDDLCMPRILDTAGGYQFVEGVKGQELILTCKINYGSADSFDIGLRSWWYLGRVGGYVNSSSHVFLCSRHLCGKNYDCSHGNDGQVKVTNLTIKDLQEEDAGWYTCATSQLYFSPEAYIYYYVTVSAAEGSSNTWLFVMLPLTIVAVTSVAVIVIIIVIIRRKRRLTRTESTTSLPRLPQFIYISYAEDSPSHLREVQLLASQLSQSFNCHLYEEFRNQAASMFVHNWLSQQISQATAIVVVCSPRYRRLTEQTSSDFSLQNGFDFVRWEHRVGYEWHLIQSRGFADQQHFGFCVVVLCDGSDESAIPLSLATNARYHCPREMSGLSEYLEGQGLGCHLRDRNEDEASV